MSAKIDALRWLEDKIGGDQLIYGAAANQMLEQAGLEFNLFWSSDDNQRLAMVREKLRRDK